MRRNKSSSFSVVVVVVLLLLLSAPVYADDHDHDHDHDEHSHSSSTPAALKDCAGMPKSNSSNVIPFDTTSLRCYTVWSSQDFVLMYKQDQPGLWSFVLTAPEEGNRYISVGFSPHGKMVGSSAMVGWMMPNGTGIAKQYYLRSKDPADCKPDSGELSLVEGSTTIGSASSRSYLSFQLNTSKPSSRLIYAVGPDGRIPGADLLLAVHSDIVSTSIDYSSGESAERDEDEETLAKSHAYLTLLGWGVVVPVGVLAARYGKSWDPGWFYTHLALQGVGFCVGLAGVIVGFKLEDEIGEEVDTHKGIGIAVLVLGSLQMLAVFLRPNKTSKVRKFWNWYHHNVGRAAIALAIANIFYGLHLAHEDESWRIGYGVFLGALGLLALLLEARAWTRKEQTTPPVPSI